VRGDHHVLIAVLSALVLLAPWIPSLGPSWIVLAIAGVFVGSLAPDADAADATIMSGFPGGRGTLRQFARHTVIVLPLIGYVIRYGIYYPLSALLWVCTFGAVRPAHRGFMHSLPGIVTTTALLFAYAGAALAFFDLHALPSLPVFGCGFFAGSLLHLLADSCTRTGICWGFPVTERRLAGTYPSGRNDRRADIFAGLLGGGAVLFLVAGPLGIMEPGAVPAGALLYCAACWALFLYDTGVHRRG
jgi:inner membrane protein